MPSNDFLTVAGSGGANVETQADYAADPVRTVFFADGEIPDANQHGKMFRQASAIAHDVAQIVIDVAALDMLDDGDNPTQIASLKTALRMIGSVLGWIGIQAMPSGSYSVRGSQAASVSGTWYDVWTPDVHTYGFDAYAGTFGISAVGAATAVGVKTNAGGTPVITRQDLSGAVPIVFQVAAGKLQVRQTSGGPIDLTWGLNITPCGDA